MSGAADSSVDLTVCATGDNENASEHPGDTARHLAGGLATYFDPHAAAEELAVDFIANRLVRS